MGTIVAAAKTKELQLHQVQHTVDQQLLDLIASRQKSDDDESDMDDLMEAYKDLDVNDSAITS